LAAWPATAAAAPDYGFDNAQWNGLTRFVALAREVVPVDLPERLDVGALQPTDGVVLLAPSGPLPVSSLADFMRAGGRVALIDDDGAGDALLALYRMTREPANTEAAPKLRSNPNLPAATAANARHPLADGVGILVANHPMELY